MSFFDPVVGLDIDINVKLYRVGMTSETHPTSLPTTAALPWRPLLLLSVGAFWTVTLELLPAGLLPAMTADLGVRPSQIGLLVTVWAVVIAASSLPLTRLTRGMGRPQVLALGLGAVGAASLVGATLPGYEAVLASRLVAAAGHGLFWSVLMVYAATIAPRGREGRAISVVLAGPVLASAVGLPLGTALSEIAGWRVVTAVVAAGMVAAAVVLRTLLPEVDDGPAVAPSGATATADPTVARARAAAVLGAVVLLGHFSAFTFVSELATGRWAIEESGLGGLLLAFGVAGAVGLVAVAVVGDRRPRLLLLGIVAALAVSLGSLAAIGSPTPAVVVVAVWGLLVGALPPALQNVVVLAASPAYRRTAGALMVTTFNLGIAAGATAGGLVIDHLGLDLLLPLAAAAVLVGLLGLLRVIRPGGRIGG